MSDTRGKLLAAARRCITLDGLAGTTSRDIASAAGANLGAITYHFGSKEELVAQALLEGLQGWLAPTMAVLASDVDPAIRATHAICTLMTTFEEHKHEAPGYLQALVEAPRIPPLHDGVVRLWGEFRSLLATQIIGMQQHRALEDWVDPDAMAGVLIAIANGLVLQATVDPEGPSVEAMAGQFGLLLLKARHAE